MRNFVKILAYVKSYKIYAVLNVVFNLLSVLFDLFSVLLFIPFLKVVFQDEIVVPTAPTKSFSIDYYENLFNYELYQYIVAYGKPQTLMVICVSVGVAFLLKNLCRYLGMFFIAVIRNGVIKDIRNEVYGKTLRLPLSYYTDQRKGDLISRITNDVQEIEWSILSSLEILFREPAAIIIFLCSLIYISPTLSLYAFILLPVAGLVIGQIGKSLKKTSSKAQQALGNLLSVFEETLTGMRIIKAFSGEKGVTAKFKIQNEHFTKLQIRAFRKRDLASPLSEFMGVAVMLCLVYFGGTLVLEGDEMGGEGEKFIGYLILFYRLIAPVKSFSTAINNANKGAASAERIDEILDSEETIINKENATRIKDFEGKVSFENVHFAYEETEVLTDVSFDIKKGQTVALVGPSGGGKSTTADLLSRFYDVTGGSIKIDGHDVRDMHLDSLRGLLGIVSQQSILFNDTVHENILFGSKTASMDDVIAAAKVANAHEFIADLDAGYQTNIGEGGSKLSGGQKQRISIARAILKNPPILILDEATSALDTESEALVQEALNHLMETRTTLVIAHRLSTIKNADLILVLDQGKVVERGTHVELISQNGIYDKLIQMQELS